VPDRAESAVIKRTIRHHPERKGQDRNPHVRDAIRLDVWLDVACLFKTSSAAKRACEGGKIEVNREHAKPHRLIREGDRIRIGRPFGRHQDVIVRIVLDQHVKKSEAKVLYDDVTPKPTAEEIE